MNEDIRVLKVKCNNLENGCQWVGELRSLDQHILKCDYTPLTCTNKCKVNGKIVTVLRKDLATHLINKCLKRQYQCPHCNKIGQYGDISTTHLQSCIMVKEKCPNDQCEETIPGCELSAHRSSCIHEKVTCKYAQLGCDERPSRKDLKSHEDDDRLHLKVTQDTVLELKGQLQQLKLENSEIRNIMYRKPKENVIIELQDFERLKRNNKTLFSAPFLSHIDGYRFCIRIDPNGCSVGHGTHITAGACIMKGDNDKSLTWPFTGSIAIELLNQLEDRNHHSMMVQFRADCTSSMRVTRGDRQEAMGKAKFISHSDLEYNPAKNCQYLVRNVLIFRASVIVPSYIYKPWLECSRNA